MIPHHDSLTEILKQLGVNPEVGLPPKKRHFVLKVTVKTD